jgi:hypothetical protein
MLTINHDHIFRYEHDRELSWAHKQQIAEDLQKICDRDSEPDDVKGSAAWQMALCYVTGFGVSADEQKADEYIVQAIRSGNDIAQRLGPMILISGAEYTESSYTEHVSKMIRQSVESSGSYALSSSGHSKIVVTGANLEKAIRTEDCRSILDLHNTLSLQLRKSRESLAQGLRTRNPQVVETLLNCGLSRKQRIRAAAVVFTGFLCWVTMLFRLQQTVYRASEARKL